MTRLSRRTQGSRRLSDIMRLLRGVYNYIITLSYSAIRLLFSLDNLFLRIVVRNYPPLMSKYVSEVRGKPHPLLETVMLESRR